MSNVYVGPYVVVDNNRIVKKTFSSLKCPNGHGYESKFCPECGTKTVPVEKEYTTWKVSMGDFPDLTNEDLFLTYAYGGKAPCFILPNKPFGPTRQMHDVSTWQMSEVAEIIVSQKLIDEEVTSFRKRFEESLKKVEQAFGDYKIRWGVLVTDDR